MRQLNALYIIIKGALFGFTFALVLKTWTSDIIQVQNKQVLEANSTFPSQNCLFCSGTVPVWVPASCWWKRGKKR